MALERANARQAAFEAARYPRRRSLGYALGSYCQKSSADFPCHSGFVLPVYSIGLISIFMSRRDQRIGDMFAGTVVVRERTDEAPTFAETFSNSISDLAFHRVQKKTDFQANISEVTESEIEVVESFLRRRWDLTDRQRLWMAWRVALPLMYKLKPDYDLQNFTYEGFLEELVHRFHSRQKFLN